METEFKYRMYCIMLRHLSGVNKAVQANHSTVEYVWKYKDEDYLKQYIEKDKTTIMVDGGTFQDMVEIQKLLEDADINHTYFIEPDLNDCMTSISVLVDERVWNRELYKSYDEFVDMCLVEYNLNDTESGCSYCLKKWYEYIGGEKNHILIEILKNKKLSI